MSTQLILNMMKEKIIEEIISAVYEWVADPASYINNEERERGWLQNKLLSLTHQNKPTTEEPKPNYGMSAEELESQTMKLIHKLDVIYARESSEMNGFTMSKKDLAQAAVVSDFYDNQKREAIEQYAQYKKGEVNDGMSVGFTQTSI